MSVPHVYHDPDAGLHVLVDGEPSHVALVSNAPDFAEPVRVAQARVAAPDPADSAGAYRVDLDRETATSLDQAEAEAEAALEQGYDPAAFRVLELVSEKRREVEAALALGGPPRPARVTWSPDR